MIYGWMWLVDEVMVISGLQVDSPRWWWARWAPWRAGVSLMLLGLMMADGDGTDGCWLLSYYSLGIHTHSCLKPENTMLSDGYWLIKMIGCGECYQPPLHFRTTRWWPTWAMKNQLDAQRYHHLSLISLLTIIMSHLPLKSIIKHCITAHSPWIIARPVVHCD